MMSTPADAQTLPATRKVRLAYIVSHPIQYQAPLLRRIAQEPDIDLTVFFGSDFSLHAYKDTGFGVDVTWDIPLLDGYHSEFLPKLRDTGENSFTSPISHGIYRRLRNSDGTPAFDALWVHGYASINSLQAILAANALGIPVLIRADVWLADRPRSPLKLAIKSFLLRGLSRLIAATLPVGSANAAYWRFYFGESFPQFLLPYAVDNDYFARKALEAASTEPELRASLDIPADAPVVLFASKLQTRKRCSDLVRAFHALPATSPSPYLVIVGDGEERSNLEALAHELNLSNVRFAGFQNQSAIPRYLQLASVFVLPARHEPWGLIVNEAMAAGCPAIVSTDVGAGPDLITNGVDGFIYPVGDIPALTSALTATLSTPQAPATMGEAARRRIATWSFDQNIAGLRLALASVTHKLRPRPSPPSPLLS